MEEDNKINNVNGSKPIKISRPVLVIGSLVTCVVLLSAVFYVGMTIGENISRRSIDYLPRSNQNIQPSPSLTNKVKFASEESFLKSLSKLTSKEYKNTTINAYSVSTYLPQTVIITDDNDSLFDAITITVSAADYSRDELFDILNDKLIATDFQTNSIFIYKIQEPVDSPERFKYIDMISLPNYDMGSLYSIRCDGNNQCSLKTAIHIEAGCNLTLDLDTKNLSTPICWAMGEDESYTPDRL